MKAALLRNGKYVSAYYGFFGGMSFGIPIGALATAWAIRLILHGLT